jgi:hypothetical protein
VRCVGPLVVALLGTLQARHRRGGPLDAAARDPAMQHPPARRVEEPVPVHAEHVRTRGERVLELRLAPLADHRRAEQADAGAGAKFALGPHDGVVGERLDVSLDRLDAVGESRLLAAGHRIQRADRPAAPRPAHELAGAEDRRRGGSVEVGTGVPALRRAADAAAVEEGRLWPEEAPVLAGAAAAEVTEDLRALGEERPPLLEEHLELREVDYRGVHLDLAEVRVEGRIEREVARHAVLEVHARRREPARAVVERVARHEWLDELGAGGGIGHQLQRAGRADTDNVVQVRHARRQAGLVLPHQLEPVRLVAALDDPLHVDAPRGAVAGREPQLRQRDPHLDRPALVVDAHGRGPHGVPRRVQELVVVDEGVALHASRRHAELRACQVVMMRVEVHEEGVGLDGHVAPRQLAHDGGRLAIAQPRGDVEGLIVVPDADLGVFRRRLALDGVALQEPGGRRDALPRRLVEPAIDDRRRHEPDGVHLAWTAGLGHGP